MIKMSNNNRRERTTLCVSNLKVFSRWSQQDPHWIEPFSIQIWQYQR